MKSFKKHIQIIILASLSSIGTYVNACVDNMDSYLTISYSLGCRVVKNAAKGIVDKELINRYNSNMKEMCKVFSNGVTKKELDMMFPQLANQSPFTCSNDAKNNTLQNIRDIFPSSIPPSSISYPGE